MRHTITLEKQTIEGDASLYVLHHRFYLFGFIKVWEYHQFVKVE